MASTTGTGDNKALRELHKSDEAARIILDDFAGRINNQRVTEVDQLMRRLRSADLSRASVIRFFKTLDELGHGEFIVGRKGSASRFRWISDPIDVGKAAQGEDLSIASMPEPEAPASDMVTHQFNLRPGMPVTIDLPADFNEKEAERLSGFLRSLPL